MLEREVHRLPGHVVVAGREVDLGEQRVGGVALRVLLQGPLQEGQGLVGPAPAGVLRRLADQVVGLDAALARGLVLPGQLGEALADAGGLVRAARAEVGPGQHRDGLRVARLGGDDLLEVKGALRAPAGAHEDAGEEEAAPRVPGLQGHHPFRIGQRLRHVVALRVDRRAQVPGQRVLRFLGDRPVEALEGAVALATGLVDAGHEDTGSDVLGFRRGGRPGGGPRPRRISGSG